MAGQPLRRKRGAIALMLSVFLSFFCQNWRAPFSMPVNRATILRGGAGSMSRSGSASSPLLSGIILITLTPGVPGQQAVTSPASQPSATTAAGSPKALKDKIVFVRSDPYMGVVGVRSITYVDSNAGGVSGRHDAPEMDTIASRNAKKNEIELMNPDGSSVTALHVFGSDPLWLRSDDLTRWHQDRILFAARQHLFPDLCNERQWHKCETDY